METMPLVENGSPISPADEPITTCLVENFTVVPETPTRRRRLFLSNIDLTLVSYYETLTFFEPPTATSKVTLSEVCDNLRNALSQLLVAYDFVAGRLEPTEGEGRLEIDCNGAGIVVVAATCSSHMSQLGELRTPKPAYSELVKFLMNDEGKELRDKPLLLFQLTQFRCGGLALASRANHCILDGISGREFQANLASFSRGEGLIVRPNADRTVFKARNPPKISYPHYEYSKLIDVQTVFSVRGMSTPTLKQPLPLAPRLVYVSPERIARLKSEALKDGKHKNCTAFHVTTAKIWKARSIAIGMPDDRISTLLFPVDVRKRVVPPAPDGFAGNALVPGFARASVHELKTEAVSFIVGKVQEGLDRLHDDEYLKSGIDWLEVHKGVPAQVDSFSVVAWWKLGLEEAEFGWGKVRCFSPVDLKPGLVMLLPGEKDEGGINICLELPSVQMKDFYKLMMED